MYYWIGDSGCWPGDVWDGARVLWNERGVVERVVDGDLALGHRLGGDDAGVYDEGLFRQLIDQYTRDFISSKSKSLSGSGSNCFRFR